MFNLHKYFSLILATSSLTYAHNILRLNELRSAKFILQQNGMVPTKQPYLEFKTDSVEICMDRCVAETPCKSINYNDVTSECQHVDYDVNDGREYINKTGFKHYDTGITQLTRILTISQTYCVTVITSDPCWHGDAPSQVYLYYKPISSDECQNIGAYYDFDRTSGTMVHHCSGLVVTRYSGYFVLRTLPKWSQTYVSNEMYIWRLNSYGYVDFNSQALHAYTGIGDGKYARYGAAGVLPPSDDRIVFDRFVQPVLLHKYDGVVFRNIDTLESDIRNRISTNGYHYSTRQSDFWIAPSMGDNYVIRMQAFFIPDVTGTYSFWLRGDDMALLFIGTDETPESRQEIARLRYAIGDYLTEHSGTKYMEYGQKYYIEILFNEIDVGDMLIATMMRPGDEDRTHIGPRNLYPFP
ncbi:uncharacterized protein [Clytia hemisphaerica]|uniref:PA14 domain-containing protein n=1 Tax=Clytia hemisphaerica TaxID=252671 RepID=A0A7M5VAW7_9CNID